MFLNKSVKDSRKFFRGSLVGISGSFRRKRRKLPYVMDYVFYERIQQAAQNTP